MAGKFFVHRSIFKHALFVGEEFSRRDAWLWMVAEARWKKGTIMIAGRPFVLQRGQFRHSLRYMAGQFGWTTGKLQRFLEKLRNDSMIVTTNDTGQLIVTVCNYGEYQSDRTETDTGGDTRPDTGKRSIHRPKKTDTPPRSNSPQTSAKNGQSRTATDSPTDTGSDHKPIQQPIQREIRGNKEEGIPTTTTSETRCTRPDEKDGGGNWSIHFLEWADQQMREAAGDCLNLHNPNLDLRSDLISWLEADADFDLDILPAIRSKAKSLGEEWNNEIGNWGFFGRAVSGACSRRTSGLPAPAPQFQAPTTRFFEPSELFAPNTEEDA